MLLLQGFKTDQLDSRTSVTHTTKALAQADVRCVSRKMWLRPIATSAHQGLAIGPLDCMTFVSAHSKIRVLQAVHILGNAVSTDLFFKDVYQPFPQLFHLQRALVLIYPLPQLVLDLVKDMLNGLIEIRRIGGDLDPLISFDVHPLEISTSLNSVVVVAVQRQPVFLAPQMVHLATEYSHVVFKFFLSGGLGILVCASSLLQAEKCKPRCMTGYGMPCWWQAA